MKIRNQHIANLVKQLKRPHNALRSPQIMHPMREWVIGLLFAAMFFGAAAVWGSATYIEYRDVGIVEVETAQTSNAAYQAQQVERSLEIVRNRTREHEMLLGITPTTDGVEASLRVTEEDELINEMASSSDVVATSTPVEMIDSASTAEVIEEDVSDTNGNTENASSTEAEIETETPAGN